MGGCWIAPLSMFTFLLSKGSMAKMFAPLMQSLYINSASCQAAHCTEREWACTPPLPRPAVRPVLLPGLPPDLLRARLHRRPQGCWLPHRQLRHVNPERTLEKLRFEGPTSVQ